MPDVGNRKVKEGKKKVTDLQVPKEKVCRGGIEYVDYAQTALQ